ncbi:MAG: hypothetical protein ABI823_00885 [Bryobacteraceae bacterium]
MRKSRHASAWSGAAILLACAAGVLAQDTPTLTCGASGMPSIPQAMLRVENASFPELTGVDVRSRTFHSRSDFLKTGFSFVRFFLPLRMRYFVKINPEMFPRGVPEDGLCAILAHELSHVVELSRGMRIRRFALIRLLSKSYTARFERRTDLEAIERGYAAGLAAYRTWIYSNIPPEDLPQKRRNYFSPEEIDVVSRRLRAQPDLAVRWRKRIPMTLDEARGVP